MIFIGQVWPFTLRWMNRLELANEYLMLTCCYFMFLYSDGLVQMDNPGWPEYDEKLPDVAMRYQIGWYNIGLLGLLILINLTVMLTAQVHSLCRSLKLWLLKRRQKNILQERA